MLCRKMGGAKLLLPPEVILCDAIAPLAGRFVISTTIEIKCIKNIPTYVFRI